MITQPPCLDEITDLGLMSADCKETGHLWGGLPKYPSMWIIGLKNAVHDTPIYLGTHSIEGNIKFLADHARGSITRNKKLSSNRFFFPRALISESCYNGMAVFGLFRFDIEVGDNCLPLD